MDPVPRLACQQCKQRKIRCDKGAPCSACRSAGLSCHAIQRARLPRGKTAKARSANANIETRIARIERLLEGYHETHSAPSRTNTLDARQLVSNGMMENFVAPDFWKSLSEEVSGLRETLESANEDQESLIAEPTRARSDETSESGTILFSTPHKSQIASYPTLSSNASATLLELYRYRVDNVYKIFHWPTVLRLFEHNEGAPQPPVAVRALQYSIFFMAFCTLTDSEAVAMDLGDRTEMLQLHQSAAEDLIARSQLLSNPDLITLQAFVVYLNALRTRSNRATTWTLLAIAVRAATALRLGDETPRCSSPIDRELRRRLLSAIGILDSHASMDRGTAPMLPSSAFQSPPLDINDSDLASITNAPVVYSQGFTDMTHTKLAYAATLCQRIIYEASLNADSKTWTHWPRMLGALTDFKLYVENDLYRFKNAAGPLAMLHNASGPKILASMELLLRRPPYRPSRNIVPPWDDLNILEVATNVLEQHMQPMLADLAPWAWKSWVQWHALAVVLAELMVQPKGSLANRAYAVATQSFARYTTLIADGDSGMLWKPIARLMHHVRRLRQSHSKEVFPHGTPAKTTLPLHSDVAVPQENSDSIETFPFNDWDFQPDVANLFTDGQFQMYEQLENVHEAENTQWLAWDCFLQDLDFPGA